MATSNKYLTYLIHLTDKAQVATLQGAVGTGGAVGAVIMAPDTAAVTYSAPKLTTNISQFLPPCLTSEWFTVGNDFPTNVSTFDRKSGGWFGIPWLFGNTTHYYWRGQFVYAPPAAPEIDDVPAPAPAVIRFTRWADGFELPNTGDGSSEGGTGNSTRMASRHTDGFGWALRSSTTVRNHLITENAPGYTPNQSWERLYVRPRAYPADVTQFWRAKGSVEANSGLSLQITPSGSLAIYQVDSVNGTALRGTASVLPLHTWSRIDILFAFGIGASLQLYINGVMVLAIANFPVGAGITTAGRTHISSEIGASLTGANTLSLDIDDWVCKDYANTPDSHDWILGTKVQLISPTAFASANAWAGDYRTLLQNPQQGSADALTNSVNGAVLAVTTDADLSVDALLGARGVASFVVAIASMTNGVSGQLGYSINGGAVVYGAITQPAGTPGWNRVQFNGTGSVAPPDVTPLELYFKHGADAVLNTVKALFAVAEVLGLFGPEDVLPESGHAPDPAPVSSGIHNAPYPRSPWARYTTPPAVQPVYKKAGTYVGNGVGQDLAFAVPPVFLWIRPLTGGAGGVVWFTSMLSSHRGAGRQIVESNLIPQALIDSAFVPVGGVSGNDLPAAPATVTEAMHLSSALAYNLNADGTEKHTDPAAWALYLTDPTYYFKRMLGWMLLEGDPNEADYGLYAFPPSGWINTAQEQALVRLSGASADSNAIGVTYAYFAFCDPAMRFSLAGALANFKGAADFDTPLFDAAFLPQAGFVLQEVLGGTTTITLHYKGIGHAAQSLSPLNAAELASALSWTTGHIVSKNAFHSTTWNQVPFLLFRRSDSSGDANIARVVTIQSYTGDGSGNRTIALLPASGRAPLWAICVPHNAAAVQRDPSHTGTTSTTLPNTANAATGIIGGGRDYVTVGSALNTNAVVYDLLVFPGADQDTGWSPPGDDWPVDPERPGPGPFDPTPPVDDPPTPDTPDEPVPPGTDPLPPTGPMPGIADDLDPACEPDTRRIVNLAISRLGQTKQIANLTTEDTTAANLARLVYKEAIETTLRDFPWPFATRYVRLALVTTAPNSEWAYAYRQPNDCVFERRIVVFRTGAVDPMEIGMALSSDATGGLIFTNQASAVLEYTCRPACVHTRSEQLFRDAVAWKLAEAMAPGLTRMLDKQQDCAQKYLAAIERARDVLRPPVPGEVQALSTVYDLTAAARLANTSVVNWALVKLGATTVRNLTTDQSKEAALARTIFENELQATLRDFPWPFATGYLTPALVGGTTAVRVNRDWRYSYRIPDGDLYVRRIVTDTERRQITDPPTYKLTTDATGRLLYTNEADVQLEVTVRPDNAIQMADALFREAFAWRLAASLAPSVAQKMPELPEQIGRGPDDARHQKERPATGRQLRERAAAYAWNRYLEAIEKARVAAANEAQQDLDPPDADWIRDR